MTSTKKTLRATFAAIAAATLTMTATPYALAADGNGETSTTATPSATTVDATFEKGNPSTITKENATLTIHKLTPATERAEGDDGKNHGLALDTNPNGSKPIQGVKFSLYTAQIKVDGAESAKAIDLKTNEGWRQANALSEKWKTLSSEKKKDAADGSITLENGDVYTFAKAGDTVTTNENGTVSATRAVGLYLVVEDNADTDDVIIKGDKDETISATGLVKADPFIVALPMTYPKETEGDDADKALTEWNYDVHVYPKNSKTDLSKAVEDYKNVGANNPANGSKLTYSISSTLAEGFVSPKTDPIPEGEKALTDFQLIDPISTDLTYIAGSDKITIDGVEDALTLNTHYKVETLDATDQPSYGEGDDAYDVGQYVRITFTKEGLDKLASNGGKKLTWTFDAQINSLEVGDDVYSVKNQPFMVPPNSSTTKNDWEPGKDTPPPTIPGNVVVSKYGKVTIEKVDNNNKKKVLNGAEFELYRCNEEGKVTMLENDKIKVVDSQDDVEAYKLSVGGDDKWTTGGNGTFTIKGLQLNDFKNGSEAGNIQAATTKALEKGAVWKDVSFYCLKEVKAPEGYNLNPQLIKFQLTTENSGAVRTLQVTNVPENAGFNLPLTGGKGVLPLIALGGLLVVGAGGYAAVAAKRNRKEA